jgi:ABC-type nitrate/sulfonate/bicarbonate transport system substrate-binding protein
MKKAIALFMAAFMSLGMLSGCNAESDVLKVALQTTAQGVPAYIAEKEGYLRPKE